MKRIALSTVVTLALSCLTSASFAESAVRLTLSAEPTAIIPEDFSGLSYEMMRLLPDEKGQHYFRADNLPLVTLFKTLGIKSLRIGGNTADRATVKLPSEQDIDALFAFAKAADVKVIYTFRLRQGDPKVAAATAKYIMDRYADRASAFAIGNEPGVFIPQYPALRDSFKKFTDVISESAAAARFCGPASTAGKTAWTRDFASDFGGSGKLAFVTQHIYPGGNSGLVANPATGRDDTLSTKWVDGYATFANGFVPAVLEKKVAYRLEEVNSFWNGGGKDASDTFAAALWSLDYCWWWASHNASGLNFHTGDFVAKEDTNVPCQYAAFWSTETGYAARPLAYGLKAFDIARHGKLVKVEVSQNADKVNLTAYSAVAADGTTYLTLINKEHGTSAKDATVSFTSAAVHGEVIRLESPQNNVAAIAGVTLGSAGIQEQGSWDGKWSDATSPTAGKEWNVTVPHASAVVVRLKK